MAQEKFDVEDFRSRISHAQCRRWLTVPEIVTILKTPGSEMVLRVTKDPPRSPPKSGTLLLYNRTETRKYKKDGYAWIRKNKANKIREDHVKLRHQGEPVVSGTYVHCSTVATMHRRSYHLVENVSTKQKLDEGTPSLILVHYLDTDKAVKLQTDGAAYGRNSVGAEDAASTTSDAVPEAPVSSNNNGNAEARDQEASDSGSQDSISVEKESPPFDYESSVAQMAANLQPLWWQTRNLLFNQDAVSASLVDRAMLEAAAASSIPTPSPSFVPYSHPLPPRKRKLVDLEASARALQRLQQAVSNNTQTGVKRSQMFSPSTVNASLNQARMMPTDTRLGLHYSPATLLQNASAIGALLSLPSAVHLDAAAQAARNSFRAQDQNEAKSGTKSPPTVAVVSDSSSSETHHHDEEDSPKEEARPENGDFPAALFEGNSSQPIVLTPNPMPAYQTTDENGRQWNIHAALFRGRPTGVVIALPSK